MWKDRIQPTSNLAVRRDVPRPQAHDKGRQDVADTTDRSAPIPQAPMECGPIQGSPDRAEHPTGPVGLVDVPRAGNLVQELEAAQLDGQSRPFRPPEERGIVHRARQDRAHNITKRRTSDE